MGWPFLPLGLLSSERETKETHGRRQQPRKKKTLVFSNVHVFVCFLWNMLCCLALDIQQCADDPKVGAGASVFVDNEKEDRHQGEEWKRNRESYVSFLVSSFFR